MSHSGYNALLFAVAPLAEGKSFFSRVVETGRHEASIEGILTGRIDIAAIDAVTLTLFRRCRPKRAAGLRVLGYTALVAGCPFITNRSLSSADLTRLRSALADVCQATQLASTRARLALAGISFPDMNVYSPIRRQAEVSSRLGYPDLR